MKQSRCRYASVFQMLRGTMVVFAGLLTIVILRRALHLHHWMGIILILAGAALVGASRCASSLSCQLVLHHICWMACKQMARAAEHKASLYLSSLCTGIHYVTEHPCAMKGVPGGAAKASSGSEITSPSTCRQS